MPRGGVLAQEPRCEEGGIQVWGLEGWRKVKVGCNFLKDLLRGIKAGCGRRPGRAGRWVALDVLGLQKCLASPGRAPDSTGAPGPACGLCTSLSSVL